MPLWDSHARGTREYMNARESRAVAWTRDSRAPCFHTYTVADLHARSLVFFDPSFPEQKGPLLTLTSDRLSGGRG